MGRVAVLLTGALVVHQLTVHAQAGERRIAVLPMEASRVEWLVGGEESELFSNPGRFALLDSLVVVKLVVFLETEFDVDFTRVEFDPERFDSVDAIALVIGESRDLR